MLTHTNNSIINYFKAHKKIILSVLIFLLIIFLLGIPFTKWWFFGADDYHGLFLGYKTKTWKDLFYFFYEGQPGQGTGPSNFIIPTEKASFLGVYYRPLYCIYLAFQYWFFGTNGYLYHLTNIFFHAVNTAILFNMFLYFINYFPAFLTAMLFVFHTQIAYRFGAIVNLHYYVNLMLVLFIFILFKKYLDTKKLIFNLLACFLFILSLFTRETTIVLPAIIFLGSYIYKNKDLQITIKSFFKQFIYNLKITSGLCGVAVGFLAIRLYLYPLKIVNTTTNISILDFFQTKILSRFTEFQVFMYDFLSLSWLPWGHKIIRGIIVISLLSLLVWLFIKNTKKIYVLYFLFCTALMLWPAYLVNYNPRYFYEVYPYILLAFIFLFKFYNGNLKPFKKIGLFILSIYIIFLAYFTVESFYLREKKMNQISIATKELVKNPNIKNRNLCFFGYPLEAWGPQNADIFWILLNNTSLQMYFDSVTAITQQGSNVVTPTKWRNKASQFFDENFVEIKREKNNQFRFTSLNPQKVVFYLDSSGYSLGQKIIHKKENEQVTDFSLIIDKKYMQNNPVFIKWNYATKRFDIID